MIQKNPNIRKLSRSITKTIDDKAYSERMERIYDENNFKVDKEQATILKRNWAKTIVTGVEAEEGGSSKETLAQAE